MSRDVRDLRAGSEARKGSLGHGLEGRRKALEDAFFQRQDEELLEKLRARNLHDQEADRIAEEYGIQDRAVLDALVDLGIQSETVPALALTPSIAMAWVDGKVTGWESWEIHEQAKSLGFEPESAPYAMLTAWLKEAPPPELLQTWITYAQELVSRLPKWERGRFVEHLLDAARAVAQASREGALEPLISEKEQALLTEIESALS